jgi:hypothetical protein
VKPHLPQPRGPVSEVLHEHLARAPGPLPPWPAIPGPLTDEDLQLALHLCYGLHYDGFAGVSDDWEWTPSLLDLRRHLEREFLRSLEADTPPRCGAPGTEVEADQLGHRLRHLLSVAGGPSLSSYLDDRGTEDTLREFVIHRSIYQRKEADPHTWVIPRVRGRAKSALVHLQSDEYGGGVPGRSHAELFATTMAALDLDPTPGAYIDQVPGVTLATDNLVSYLGLHRRWRGALVGHLAAFEMTSVVPMTRYASAVRRILRDEQAAEFYDVHVRADVEHGEIAATDLVTGLAESDPQAAEDVLFGAGALLGVERRFTEHLLASWALGASSLRLPSPEEGVRAPTDRHVPCPDRLRFGRDALLSVGTQKDGDGFGCGFEPAGSGAIPAS